MAVSSRLRFEILRRDNHACRYCGRAAPEVKLTVDHVIPETLGGTDHPDNLVAACSDCNGGKSSSFAGALPNVNQDTLPWSEAIRSSRQDFERQKWAVDALTTAALEGLTDDDRQRFLDQNYLGRSMAPLTEEKQRFGAACEAIETIRDGHLSLNATVDELLDTLSADERSQLDVAFADYCREEQDAPSYDISLPQYLLRVALDEGYTLIPQLRGQRAGQRTFKDLATSVLRLVDEEECRSLWDATPADEDSPWAEHDRTLKVGFKAAAILYYQIRELKHALNGLLGHLPNDVHIALEHEVDADYEEPPNVFELSYADFLLHTARRAVQVLDRRRSTARRQREGAAWSVFEDPDLPHGEFPAIPVRVGMAPRQREG